MRDDVCLIAIGRKAVGRLDRAVVFAVCRPQHQALLAQHARIYAQIQGKQNRLAAYRYYQQEATNIDINNLTFSPYLCLSLLDKGVVSIDGTVEFVFCDGLQRTVFT